ncbi:MAG: glycyl-tRNA synthetase subunit beta, partial [Pseudomonadota bacterium]
MAQDLLLEIGAEELPAAFVKAAIQALPNLIGQRLRAVRLAHGEVRATGTPRRLAVRVAALASMQPDFDAQVVGPPERVAFDKDGRPTLAAESFASKNNVELSALYIVDIERGRYVAARRVEKGHSTLQLLPEVLAHICSAVGFPRLSGGSDREAAFGASTLWILALLDGQTVPFSFSGAAASNKTYGHRLFAPEQLTIDHSSEYLSKLREAHVLVEVSERQKAMTTRLALAAAESGGELVKDAALMSENESLFEEPQVMAGNFDEGFLALPECVILEVARDEQRGFGVRGKAGRLLPKYLVVVDAGEVVDTVSRDCAMRARLSDAKSLFDEDSRRPLAEWRAGLDAVIFQKRLGGMGDRVTRLVALTQHVAARQGLSASARAKAVQVAELCKCDRVTSMVLAFPKLQGRMGRAYAIHQGIAADVADAIEEHYAPRGATDPTAASDLAAAVGLADRLDTLVAGCAINLMPAASADPLALRQASIGILRTLIDKRWRLSLTDLVRDAFAGLSAIELDLGEADTVHRLSGFLRHRLRGVLSEKLPQDAVDACLAARSDCPYDVELRAVALAQLDAELRLKL